jgi:hypothetical protein
VGHSRMAFDFIEVKWPSGGEGGIRTLEDGFPSRHLLSLEPGFDAVILAARVSRPARERGAAARACAGRPARKAFRADGVLGSSGWPKGNLLGSQGLCMERSVGSKGRFDPGIGHAYGLKR